MKAGAPWEHTLDPEIGGRGSAPFRGYLFWFLILTAICYVAAFPMVRSKAYPKWSGQQWGPMLDFTFAPGDQSADVLIFGDSSAFIGVDPHIVSKDLGLSALLLPNTIGSLPIIGDLPLRRYLKTHAQPRILVFYFSPWNLDYTHAKKVRFFEGEEMMLRHGTASEIADFAVHHPTEALFFPFRFYNAYGSGIVRWALGHAHPAPSVAASLGHLDDNDPFGRLTGACKIPASFFEDRRTASVQHLAQKYAGQIPEMVYISPVPGCRNASAALQGSFSSLDAAPPVILPAPEFVGDIYYAHIEPGSVPIASHLLAQAVKKRMAAPFVNLPGR